MLEAVSTRSLLARPITSQGLGRTLNAWGVSSIVKGPGDVPPARVYFFGRLV